jgi:hypothetical protein
MSLEAKTHLDAPAERGYAGHAQLRPSVADYGRA